MAQRKTSDGRYVLQKGEYERTGERHGFMYRWRDAYGVQCSISDLTLSELRAKEKEVKVDQLEGKLSSQQRRTVNDFYNLWLSQKKRSKIKQNVLSNYMYMYDRFVAKSRLGKMAIKDVRKSDIKKLYGDLLDTASEYALPYAPKKLLHKPGARWRSAGRGVETYGALGY